MFASNVSSLHWEEHLSIGKHQINQRLNGQGGGYLLMPYRIMHSLSEISLLSLFFRIVFVLGQGSSIYSKI